MGILHLRIAKYVASLWFSVYQALRLQDRDIRLDIHYHPISYIYIT